MNNYIKKIFVKNENCLVTGATGKIGAEISVMMASIGYNLILTDNNVNKLNNLKGISLDQDKDLKNLHRYRHLITDFSGIALEYFYLTKRSVLFLDVSKKIKRKLGTKEKKLKLIENDMRTIIGDIISLDKISDLNSFPTIENKISLEFINEINSNVNSLENTLEALRKNNLN